MWSLLLTLKYADVVIKQALTYCARTFIAAEHTILDVLAFSCPVPAAELRIVEYRFLFGGDFGMPGGSLSIQVRL